MNWGYKILMVYGVFVIGMIFLAYKSSQQNIELVTEDYYAKELVFQKKIDETRRASLLSAPVELLLTSRRLTIKFPKDFAEKEITGDAILYCPADQAKDLHQHFELKDSALTIDVPENYYGLYYVKIGWLVNGVSYYVEKKITIKA